MENANSRKNFVVSRPRVNLCYDKTDNIFNNNVSKTGRYHLACENSKQKVFHMYPGSAVSHPLFR